MSRVRVRSEALSAAARAAEVAAEELREVAAGVLAAAPCRPPPLRGPLGADLLVRWLRLEGSLLAAVGPGGLLGASTGLAVLAGRLRLAARAYEEVESAVADLLRAVARGADAAGGVGWFTDGPAAPVLTDVPSTWEGRVFGGPADLVAAGAGLDGGRVRVVEVSAGDGGSAWVVVVPGTQRWSPAAGSNPFDLTTDVRAVTSDLGDVTVAAAGVAGALDRAMSASGRSAVDDPVVLVGHSQGGILAAALAADPGFTRGHRVTHVVTTGAPVALFPVPEAVQVLSVEHARDPVPGLDLTPNPSRSGWTTLRAGEGPPLDVRRHDLGAYVATVRSASVASATSGGGVAGWTTSAAAFLGGEVRSVHEVEVRRP
jgi:hypothetical protein